jgi:hypothetical protein
VRVELVSVNDDDMSVMAYTQDYLWCRLRSSKFQIELISISIILSEGGTQVIGNV